MYPVQGVNQRRVDRESIKCQNFETIREMYVENVKSHL